MDYIFSRTQLLPPNLTRGNNGGNKSAKGKQQGWKKHAAIPHKNEGKQMATIAA